MRILNGLKEDHLLRVIELAFPERKGTSDSLVRSSQAFCGVAKVLALVLSGVLGEASIAFVINYLD